MIATLESGKNPELKKANFLKLTTLGIPLVERISKGFDSVRIDELLTNDGKILRDDLLRIVTPFSDAKRFPYS